MQKYPEVYSLEKSLAILEKYKDELSVEQYEQNRSIHMQPRDRGYVCKGARYNRSYQGR